jgi:uncharacterized protein YfaA (DUF2138 family)
MASVIFFPAAETVRVAINATGVKSIVLLESVVIDGSFLHELLQEVVCGGTAKVNVTAFLPYEHAGI